MIRHGAGLLLRPLLRLAPALCVLAACGGRASADVELSADKVGRYEMLEMTVTGLVSPRFPDVPEGHWAFREIGACVRAGIVAGYPDGTYRPTTPVDRAQMAVFVSRALAGGDQHIPAGPESPTFPDVPRDHWAFRYIEYAAANRIVAGYPDGNYAPAVLVDRGQMAVFIARSIVTPTGDAGLASFEPPAVPTFPDVTPDGKWSWCYRHVEYIAAAGITHGYEDNLYHPERVCTRDQMAVYVQRGFGLPPAYDNPFDPAEIDLVAEIHTPSGSVVSVPGFYYVPYQRSRGGGGEEILTQAGPGVFKIRFAARGEPGTYTYAVTLTDSLGSREIGAGSFEVTESTRPGYVRRSTRAPLYFEFDSGEPYFAIGENICWPGAGGTYDYDAWLGALAAHGGNYLRLWLVNEWNKLGLEHLSLAPGDGNGLGRYDQAAAWRIDYVLDLADQLGCEALMCIDSFNSLDASGIYGMWDRFPYNQVWGGPCAAPEDFFTDPEAKRLFRQRLRYLVARWGYSTAVLAWEFWNEVDIVTNYNSAAVAAWHAEMADYLRSIDPWQHLITTSFANTAGDPAVDGLPQMDFVQSHNYGSHDMAAMVHYWTAAKTAAYGKPHYLGEFGSDWLGGGNESDPDGIHLHNGLWSAMLSGSAGTAMLWWWDSYVHPNDLYYHFGAVAAYAAGIDWPGQNYGPATVLDVRYAPGHEPSTYPPLSIEPTGEAWYDGSPYNEPHTYEVGGDGTITNLDVLSRVLHGLVNHPTWHNPATFLVDYPTAGKFEVMVSGVSGWGGAHLVIRLDGSVAREDDFPDTLPDDHDTMHQYDGTYSIDVPAGTHTIVVENTGTDWFYLSYRLTNYLTVPNLRVLALSNATSALVWVQNAEHTWWNHANGIDPMPVNESEIVLGGLTPGDYDIERWDTYAGGVAQAESRTCGDGTVVLTTPPGLTTDTAFKLARRASPPV